ncbi:zinc finger BED domain-containing 4-like, partial [Pelobates cultripes]
AKEWLTEDMQKEVQVLERSHQEEPGATNLDFLEEHATSSTSLEEHATSSTSLEEQDDDATETYKFPKRKHMEKSLKHGQIDAMFSVLLGPHVEDTLTLPKVSLDNELHLYLKEPVINRKGNPLEWWKENETHFKTLASYARRYLCYPPSSVPSERVFSEVSAIYERNRNRLTGEHAEMLCFLHYNVLLLNWKY